MVTAPRSAAAGRPARPVRLAVAEPALAAGTGRAPTLVRLVLVGGLPGTGKSTVAGGLHRRYGWPVLRSDVIRARLAGRVPQRVDAQPGGGIHQPDWTAATYAALLDEAETQLRDGRSVIVDATWTDAAHRSAAARLAGRVAADLVMLNCEAPEAVALGRLGQRTANGRKPDAIRAAYRYLADRADPWPDAARLDTSVGYPDTLAAAVRAVAAAYPGHPAER